MSSTLDMLRADLREIEAHLAVWPTDKYALHRHGLILEDIEAATPPMTSDQRPSTLRGAKPVPGPYSWMAKAARDALPKRHGKGCDLACHMDTSHCHGCTHKIRGGEARQVIADDVTEQWTFGPAKPKEGTTSVWQTSWETDQAPRFTFGEDYEMDQQWLARERAKAASPVMMMTPGGVVLREVVPQPTPAEPDRMMFSTMAYDLTSLYNLNYGTSRY